MSLSDQKITGFTKRISQLADQPNMQPQELKAYFDSSPEELRQAHNGLCDALCAADAAAGLGFQRTAGVPADTVQAAVENVQQQVNEAVMGNIPSGSVTQDKLAQDVRDRFSSIEAATEAEAAARAGGDSAEASARAAADNNLQTQINAKCEVIVGSYVGDQTENRFINLGRTPKAVLLITNDGKMFAANENAVFGGLAVTDSPSYASSVYPSIITIVTNGFQVTYSNLYKSLATNRQDKTYNYIALI